MTWVVVIAAAAGLVPTYLILGGLVVRAADALACRLGRDAREPETSVGLALLWPMVLLVMIVLLVELGVRAARLGPLVRRLVNPGRRR